MHAVQVCKWHSGRESFGQRWSAGDVVGCLLDLDAGQVAFSLNGDLLQDSLGSSVAFEGLSGVPLVPAITLAAGQTAQLNFGRSEVHVHCTCCTYRYMCTSIMYGFPATSGSPIQRLLLTGLQTSVQVRIHTC